MRRRVPQSKGLRTDVRETPAMHSATWPPPDDPVRARAVTAALRLPPWRRIKTKRRDARRPNHGECAGRQHVQATLLKL